MERERERDRQKNNAKRIEKRESDKGRKEAESEMGER
jgi:hypothetical protein